MFVEIIEEGATPTSPTTLSNLRAWVTALKVPFTSGIDTDPASFTAKTTYGIKETTYIVDRTTRKILAKAKTPEDGLTQLGTLP